MVQNDPNANLAGQAGEGRIPNGGDVVSGFGARWRLRDWAALCGRPHGRGGLFQEGLASILSDTDSRIVASACGVDGLVLSLLPQDQRLLLIVDAGDDLSLAAGQMEVFRDRHPTTRVAVLTDRIEIGDLLFSVSCGGPCVLCQGGHARCPPQIARAGGSRRDLPASGRLAVDPAIGGRRDPRGSGAAAAKGACLSAQEKCVLRCLAEGDSNKVIANKIDIAVATVKVHVNSIFRKIGTCNRTQAAIWARNNISQDEPAGERTGCRQRLRRRRRKIPQP